MQLSTLLFCSTTRFCGLAYLLLGILISCAAQDCVPQRYNTNASRIQGKLNVHLVPHTHDDSGWLKTVDQYYYGSNNNIQLAAVQYILDTVVEALAKNPDRKFVYGELSFFTRWWQEQTEDTKDLVRKLVDQGQLDFVNGGYVQHDEAAAHYVAMIDQTTLGHSFLKEQFGKVPSIGWQLDPFGHSATHAALMSGLLGFDGLFFGRADYLDMEKRRNEKQMEMLWRGAESFGDQADVFTANFPTGNYGAPGGFWYDPWSTDDPIMDNKCLFDYNVKNRVDAFVQASRDIASVTYGDDILIPFGSDFQWVSAHQYYKNLDKLIHHVNEDGRINIFYSTPAEYVAVKHGYNHSWPLKTDDFFPYADCPVCYWTGYFTSRPASKGWIRDATSYLQGARQLEVLTRGHNTATSLTSDGIVSGDRASTASLEEAVSLLQHHDAITGTEKQHVTDDYHIRLAQGWKESEKVFTDALAKLLTSGPATTAKPNATQHFSQQAPSRRMLASKAQPSHRMTPGNLLLHQSDSTEPAQDSMHSLLPKSNSNSNVGQQSMHSAYSMVVSAEGLPTSPSSPAGSHQLPAGAPPGSCQAAEESASICRDAHQPAWQPRAWEGPEASDAQLTLQQCQLLNASICAPSVTLTMEGTRLLVVAYNSLAWERPTEPVRVPVSLQPGVTTHWLVAGPDGKPVESQVVPVSSSTKKLQSLLQEEGIVPDLDAAATHELVFLAHLPPLGYAGYTITTHTSPEAASAATSQVHTVPFPASGASAHADAALAEAQSASSLFIDNGLLRVDLSNVTGQVTGLQNWQAKVSADLDLDVAAYLSGDQHAGGQDGPPSGAYIFRPDGLLLHDVQQVRIVKGPVVSEVHQIFTDYTAATIRLWDKALHVEVEWTVGPIPIDDKKGKEVVLRYASSLDSGATFYTDSNGREYLKRVRDFRPTWNLNITEPVSGNYYPLTAGTYIQEEGKAELAVLTDRAQGGASLRSGQLEIMLHRRTLFDDWRGVGEPLNETMQGCRDCPSPGLVARGRHWLTLQDLQTAAEVRRTFQQRLNDPVILSFAALPNQASSQQAEAEQGLVLQYSAVKAALPLNVHLLTLKALPDGSVLLRLAHLYQVGEHADLAKPVKVDLSSLFSELRLSELSELSLSANRLQSDVQRLKWTAGKSLSGQSTEALYVPEVHAALSCQGSGCIEQDWTVSLNPMEIRTFLIGLQ